MHAAMAPSDYMVSLLLHYNKSLSTINQNSSYYKINIHFPMFLPCLYLLCLCLCPYLSLALRFSFFSNLRFVGLLTLHYGTADPMPININPTSHRNAPPIPQTMESGATRDEDEAGTVDQRIGGSMSDRAQALATTVQVK